MADDWYKKRAVGKVGRRLRGEEPSGVGNGRRAEPEPEPEVKYYQTKKGTVTFRAGGATPPEGSIEISQTQYSGHTVSDVGKTWHVGTEGVTAKPEIETKEVPVVREVGEKEYKLPKSMQEVYELKDGRLQVKPEYRGRVAYVEPTRKKYPIREERISETERKQRILETLEKQEETLRKEVRILAPPTERDISPEELLKQIQEERRDKDESRISGDGIDGGVDTRNLFISSKETPIQKLRTLSEKIQRIKKSREELGIGEGIERIHEFSRFITGGGESYISIVAAGAVTSIIGFPFLALDVATRIPETALKVAALAAGLTIPETRELTKEESKRAFEAAIEILKQPETIGAALAIPLIGVLANLGKPTVRTGVTKDGVKTTILKFKGKGKGRVTSFKSGDRAVVVVTGKQAPLRAGEIVPISATEGMVSYRPSAPLTVPRRFIAPTEIVAQRVLEIKPPKVERFIELKEQVIPTQFDIFGRPITPIPKVKEPITTMIGKDIVVDILKPTPPVTLQRIEVTGALPVFAPSFDVPVKFVEIGKDIQIKLPVAEPKLVVYDPVTNKIRLLGRKDIRTQGGGFLGEREIFFKDNGRFVEAERFQVIREISPQAGMFRVGRALTPKLTIIETAKQKTILDLFRKEGKKEISLAEVKKRLGKEKYDELMGRKITEKKIPKKKTRREKIIEARQALISRKPEARLTFMETLRGAVRVEPVFRRIGERFGFQPLQRVTPQQVTRARVTPRELAMRMEAGLLPAMVIPTQVSATRTALSLGLTPTQEQLRLTEQLKIEEQKIVQEQLKLTEQIKVEESIEVQEQLKVQEQIKIQERVQVQEQLQVLEQLSVTEQVGITQQIGITPPITPILLVPPLVPPGIPPKEKAPRFVTLQKEKGFDVMVREGERRQDKFKRIAKNLPRNRALRKGRDIVDNYIEATFRIKSSGKTTTVTDDLTAPDLSKFRRPVSKSRLPRDSLIEKVKHRIDSIGEKQQLSYFKELAARKKQLQSQIGFIKTQRTKQIKKQQLQSIISTRQQQVNFISSSKSTKKKGRGKTFKWL